jgi:hypothetical protein
MYICSNVESQHNFANSKESGCKVFPEYFYAIGFQLSESIFNFFILAHYLIKPGGNESDRSLLDICYDVDWVRTQIENHKLY